MLAMIPAFASHTCLLKEVSVALLRRSFNNSTGDQPNRKRESQQHDDDDVIKAVQQPQENIQAP